MSKNKQEGPTANKVGSHGGDSRDYTLTIDTLALTVVPVETGRVFNLSTLVKDYKHDIPYTYIIGEEYILTDSVKNDPSYRYSFNVLYYGEKVAELHTNGIRGKKEYIKLNFECNLFYQKVKGWYDHYADITRLLRLKVNNNSVIHVAHDSHGTYQWMKDRCMLSHWILEKGHHGIKYLPLKDARFTFSGTEIIIGATKSGKRVAYYPKSSEIQKSGKWYIRDYHERNGLDVTRQIDRVEARLTSTWLKDYYISLEELNTQEGLERLFLAAVKDVGFVDLSTQDKGRHTNYKVKHKKEFLFNPDLFDGRAMKKVEKPHTGRTGKKSIYGLRSTFKNLLYSYIMSGRSQELHYLRHFISCEDNWMLFDKANKHNGLISLERLNLDNYRMLTNRYVKDYTKEGHELGKEVEVRLIQVESRLFDPQPAPISVTRGDNKVKIMSAHAAIYSRHLFMPSGS